MKEESTIKQCSIVVTRQCNLRCNFCYAKSAGYGENDLIDYNDIKNIIDFCFDAKVKYIFFTGGEPLTYPYLFDALKYIKTKPHRIETALATNGVLLKNFDFCKKLIDNGLEYIDVSMKGKNSQEWREVVGVDGLDAQLQGIRNLSSLSINFTCSMVITSTNVQSFCEVVKIAHDNGAKQFSFTFIIDNNNTDVTGIAYLQKFNPIKLVNDFISQIDRLNTITDDWWIEYSFPLCIYTEYQLQILKGRLATPCQVHLENAVTFNTKLELLPCDMYIHQPLGRFRDDFLTYQQYNLLINKKSYIQTIKTINTLPSGECTSCEHLNICQGGCPVLWKNYSFADLMNFKATHSLD